MGNAAVMAMHDGIAHILHIILIYSMVLIAALLPLFCLQNLPAMMPKECQQNIKKIAHKKYVVILASYNKADEIPPAFCIREGRMEVTLPYRYTLPCYNIPYDCRYCHY